LYAVPTLLAAIVCVFFLMHLTPGDPIRVMLGVDATEEEVDAVREKLGLDRPLLTQLLYFLRNVARGDLGESIYFRLPVLSLLLSRLGATVELAGVALLIAVVVAIPLGVVAAVRRYSLVDSISSMMALTGVSVPSFWLGILLLYFFAVKWRVLPLTGRAGPPWTVEGLRHILLPGMTLGATLVASTTRLTRASMLEVLNQDFMRTARAKGLREAVVIYKHGLKNALIPVVTNLGLQMGVVLGGAFLTETVFAWPGIGRLTVQAILRRDFPIIQGTTLFLAAGFVLINILVDIVYVLLDPRIRYR